jgi:sugar lactone lactonase YvrE
MKKAICILMVPIIMLCVPGCKKDPVKKFKKDVTSTENLTDDPTAPYYVSSLAGDDNGGAVDGVGPLARFSAPRGITASDGFLYNVDQGSASIRKTKINDGTVTTLAGGSGFGYVNGAGQKAKFNGPIDIAVGPDKYLYVTEFFNFKIRKVNTCLCGIVSTFAGRDSGYVDGPINKAKFGRLTAIGIGKDGTMYVYDFSAAKIRKISTDGIVSSYAGSTPGDLNGPAHTAKFSDIESILVADDGTLYVADALTAKVKKIATNGNVTTFAGSTFGYTDGPGTSAQFIYPYGLTMAPDGKIYVADQGNNMIRMINSSGVVSTTAGSDNQFGDKTVDGPASTAKFLATTDIVYYDHALYVTDAGKIRKVTLP